MTSSLTPNKYFIEHFPFNKILIIKDTQTNATLKINTKTYRLIDDSNESLSLSHAFKISLKVDAIYGKIKLNHHSYLIVVDRSKLIGRITDKKVYQVLSTHFINISEDPEAKDSSTVPAGGVKLDEKLIAMMKEHLDSGFLYYSDNYCLTSNLQSQLGKETNYSDHDSSFFINMTFAEKFTTLKGNSYSFVAGFIYGFVSQTDVFLKNGKIATFTLLSRKHVKRLGSRFYSRGIDTNGNVSNFAETETILEIPEGENTKRIISHVQIRGSIPLYWSQKPTLNYTPKIELEKNDSANEQAMKHHFRRLTRKYNGVQCINLIDKKGSQLKIGSSFDRIFKGVKEADGEMSKLINLEWFDYHYECRNMNIAKIKNLIQFISVNISNYGYFEATISTSENQSSVTFKKTQKGVIRTNCIDCLDRTNVFQSVFSRLVLNEILFSIGQGKENYDCLTEFHGKFETVFRNDWTDNANALSKLYSGTNALKTDFTRTGKRTIMGMIDDGKNSATRYFYNNLTDHHKQNTMDLLTENLKPEQFTRYEKHNPKEFLVILFCFLLMPLFVGLSFKLFGIRCNSGFLSMLVVLSTFLSYLFVVGMINRQKRCIFERTYSKRIRNQNKLKVKI